MNYPNNLLNLINSFKRLPGIGEKSAERMAFSVMKFDEKTLDTFSDSIMKIKNIKKCEICNSYTEEKLCTICKMKSRDNSKICVVEEFKNINVIEKTGNFNGLYHVLEGLISPLEGIEPNDINIEKLFDRVRKTNVNEKIGRAHV